jgi:hypothetical protein
MLFAGLQVKNVTFGEMLVTETWQMTEALSFRV